MPSGIIMKTTALQGISRAMKVGISKTVVLVHPEKPPSWFFLKYHC